MTDKELNAILFKLDGILSVMQEVYEAIVELVPAIEITEDEDGSSTAL